MNNIDSYSFNSTIQAISSEKCKSQQEFNEKGIALERLVHQLDGNQPKADSSIEEMEKTVDALASFIYENSQFAVNNEQALKPLRELQVINAKFLTKIKRGLNINEIRDKQKLKIIALAEDRFNQKIEGAIKSTVQSEGTISLSIGKKELKLPPDTRIICKNRETVEVNSLLLWSFPYFKNLFLWPQSNEKSEFEAKEQKDRKSEHEVKERFKELKLENFSKESMVILLEFLKGENLFIPSHLVEELHSLCDFLDFEGLKNALEKIPGLEPSYHIITSEVPNPYQRYLTTQGKDEDLCIFCSDKGPSCRSKKHILFAHSKMLENSEISKYFKKGVCLLPFKKKEVIILLNYLYGKNHSFTATRDELRILLKIALTLSLKEATNFATKALSKPIFKDDKTFRIWDDLRGPMVSPLNSETSDLIIQCHDGIIKTHTKLIKNTIFSKLLGQGKALKMSAFPKHVIEQALNFQLLGSIQTSKEDLLWLFKLADDFQISEIKEAILSELKSAVQWDPEKTVDLISYYLKNHMDLNSKFLDLFMSEITISVQNDDQQYNVDDPSVSLQKRSHLFSLLERNANEGNIAATVLLGKCLLQGFGRTPRNPENAFKLFEMAANKGSLAAKFEIGKCYENESNQRAVKPNKEKAFEIYSELSKEGYPPAIMAQAKCYLYGIGVKKNQKLAEEIFFFSSSSLEKEPEAMAYRGESLIKTAILERLNFFGAKGLRLLNEAAALGNVKACKKLITLEENADNSGLGFLQQIEQKLGRRKNTIVAAKAGDLESIRILGQNYATGEGGVDQDLEESAEWYEKGALKGSAQCMTKLADLIKADQVPGKTHNDALILYCRAARKNDPYAIKKLKEIIEGQPIRFNEDLAALFYDGTLQGGLSKAIVFYEKAANSTDSETAINALRKLGNLYLTGKESVEANPKKAFKYYLKAAEKGDVSSQLWVAYLCIKGKGTLLDTERGIEFLNTYEALPYYLKEEANSLIAGAFNVEELIQSTKKEMCSYQCKDGTITIPAIVGNKPEFFQNCLEKDVQLLTHLLKAGTNDLSRENLLRLASISQEPPFNGFKIKERGIIHTVLRALEKIHRTDPSLVYDTLIEHLENLKQVKSDQKEVKESAEKRALEDSGDTLATFLGSLDIPEHFGHSPKKMLALSHLLEDKTIEGPIANLLRAKILQLIDSEKAFQEFLALSKFGDICATYELAKCYEFGKGVEKDLDKAFSYHNQLVERGFLPAFVNLGTLVESMGKKNEGFELYLKAAEMDFAPAMLFLGVFCIANQNNAAGISWLEKAADQNVAHSIYLLGTYYLNEIGGLKKNKKKAFDHFAKSSALNSVHGMYALAERYRLGEETPQDFAEAIKLYTKTAEFGHIKPMEKLANAYKNGWWGLRPNMKKAFKFFKEAALKGSTTSQFWVGYFYHQGLGIDQNFEEAKKWYDKCSDKQINKREIDNLDINDLITRAGNNQK